MEWGISGTDDIQSIGGIGCTVGPRSMACMHGLNNAFLTCSGPDTTKKVF